ncbi:DNA methyltransferase [Limosilactobacillus reuteri]|uniref:DNA methyltransferase n=1 Tax=Limosilactobacillus reuteri TaxID=1598 RepID=UPI00128BA989|nr:DNA methyltransferase [Limosilactobacillus reuteri]MQB69907.1 methylase [Limosilactobacillus reuteri]MQC05247.1 methylase [Limosilactobacillus reuteri]
MPTRQQAAREFVKTWSSDKKGREDADRQTFWNDLLQRVYGIDNYYDYITYEKDVQVKADGKVTTRRIDGYIPSTKIMVEMKGKNIKDLSKPITQSGGDELTPFEQAKRYANFLPNSEQPRWILVSNFNEIDIHDMERPLDEPKVIKLEDLPKKVKSLEFMVDANQQQVIDEKQLSVDAGNLVAKIYNELTNAYAAGRGIDVNEPRIQRSLNMLIVRLVFLLYADDSNLFGKEDIFQAFIERREPRDIRRDLGELFKVLDQPEEQRDPYLDDEFNQFAYVNGGMFSDENVIIPQFTDELKQLIVEDAGHGFDWSGISPTIFGAVFESTLNPETRRSGGMHYTSIENIHKVIDPLFLNDLHDEFDKIQNMGNRKQRVTRAKEFRDKLGKLKFFDPACGSGNFLTETYLSLRKMENECLRIIVGNQGALALTGESEPKVKIQNFYGIEINDFAVSVARTAMWIAESQMWEQTKDITFANKDFLPLDSNDSIYEGNALHMNWEEIIKPYELSYIMGNPPFIGKKYQNKSQKEDLIKTFGKGFKGVGSLDYVTGWFEKAASFIENSTIMVGFVSTNSITQGEIVGILWKHLIEKYGIVINFAYRTFVWNNEAKNKAAVFCVIIGFSGTDNKQKLIFTENNTPINVKHISPYLIAGNDMIVERSSKVLEKGAPKMIAPNKPVDYNTLKLTQNEKDEMVKRCPETNRWIKRLIGAQELIKGIKRYCLWLVDITPAQLKQMPPILERVEACRKARIEHGTAESLRLAETPTLFREQINPSNYLAIPAVSSQRREYVPMDYLHADKIPVMGILIIPNADKYLFGLLESKVHMAWMRLFAGRLKSDYRYSKNIVYNTFPWPNIDEKEKGKISKTAQAILDARSLYPDSSLADLYDPLTMPIELRKAHEANDKAVLKAYGLKPSATEPEIVQHLFKMYEKLTKKDW